MSVIIIGIDKPENCSGCMFNPSNCQCRLTHGTILDDNTCDEECPMVQIPQDCLIDYDRFALVGNFR